MKKHIFPRTLLLILPLILLGSCIKQEDITLKEVENISVQGFSRIDLSLKVENQSGSKLRIEDARMELCRGEMPLVDLMLSEPILIPRKSTSSIPVSLRLKLANPLGALSLMGDLKSTLSQLTVSGEITAKAGWARKKIRFDDVPFTDFLRTFGADTDELFKMIQS